MIREEKSQITIMVDGKQAINELGKLEMQARDLRDDIKAAKKGTDDYIKANASLDKVNADITKLRKEIGVTGLTMSQLAKYQGDLNREINLGTTQGTQRYAELKGKLQEVNLTIQQQKNDLKGLQEQSAATAGSMRYLKEQAATLDTELQELSGHTTEFANKSAQLQKVRAELLQLSNTAKGLDAEVEGAVGSLARMKDQAKKLGDEIHKLAPNTAAFTSKARELQQVEARIAATTQQMRGFAGAWANFKTNMMNVAGGVIGGNLMLAAFQKLVEFIPNLISGQAKLSDSFADIRKTTGMSSEAVKDFNKQLSTLNTRTATDELRKVAIIAGQLGIAQKDIFEFTQSIDTLVVSLSDEFLGGAEQITKEMGALRNIFSDIKTDDVGQDMLHIGNAINTLGAEGAATGPVIADFASRIGGVGVQLGLTSGQILGISATLQELNVTAERGGTAVVKILQRMAATPEEFAKVAGIGVDAFTKLVDTDLFGAFHKVVEGSKKAGSGASALAGILKTLDVDGAGASEVFAKLGGNMDMLTQKVAHSNEALQTTDSIMNEFGIKNENLAAKLEKLGKALSKAFTSSTVNTALESMVNWLYQLMPATEQLSNVLAREQATLDSTTLSLMSLNVGTEERTRMIKELQAKYPDYLGSLNAETVSNQELKNAINQVTNALIEQMIVQAASEKITAQAQKAAALYEEVRKTRAATAEKLKEFYEQERKNGQKIAELQELKNKLTVSGMSLERQYEFIQKGLSEGRIKSISKINEGLYGVQQAVVNLRIAEKAYNTETQKTLDLEKERRALYLSLGRSPTGETAAEKAAQRKAAADKKAAKEANDKAAADSRAIARQLREKEEAEKAAKEREAERKKEAERLKQIREQQRKLTDLQLSLEKDEYVKRRAQTIENSRRMVEDYQGSAAQKKAFVLAAETKLNDDLFHIDVTFYNQRNRERRERSKAEAERKALEAAAERKQALDNALKEAELHVLLAEKINDNSSFDKNRSQQLIRELKIRRGAELENTRLTEAEREAITKRYDLQIKAFRIASDADITTAKLALLEVQMSQELASHKGSVQEKALITAKYLSEMADLRTAQSEKEIQESVDKVEEYLNAVNTILSTISELRVMAIDEELDELKRVQEAKNQQFDLDKQRLNERMALEEAAKNERLSKAEQEKNKNIASYQAQFKNKKMSEAEFNRLKEKAETDYAALKTAEDNKFTASKEANEKKLIFEKEKAEAEYRRKERDLKIQQFNLEKQSRISSAIIEGAVGLVKAIASGDYLRAVLVGITTAASIAKIEAQKPAFEQGGSTEPFPFNGNNSVAAGGTVSKPYLATVAEKGAEYIIPNWQLKIPAVANIVGILETMRLSRSSNTEALTASQGKRNLSVSATNASAEATPNVMEIAMLSALQRLNYNLENPKPSAAVLDYNRFDEDYSTFKQTIEDSNV